MRSSWCYVYFGNEQTDRCRKTASFSNKFFGYAVSSEHKLGLIWPLSLSNNHEAPTEKERTPSSREQRPINKGRKRRRDSEETDKTGSHSNSSKEGVRPIHSCLIFPYYRNYKCPGSSRYGALLLVTRRNAAFRRVYVGPSNPVSWIC